MKKIIEFIAKNIGVISLTVLVLMFIVAIFLPLCIAITRAMWEWALSPVIVFI